MNVTQTNLESENIRRTERKKTEK